MGVIAGAASRLGGGGRAHPHRRRQRAPGAAHRRRAGRRAPAGDRARPGEGAPDRARPGRPDDRQRHRRAALTACASPPRSARTRPRATCRSWASSTPTIGPGWSRRWRSASTTSCRGRSTRRSSRRARRSQIKRKRYTDFLRNNLDHSLELAVTDQLTGLHNRRYMTGQLGALVARGQARRRAGRRR